MGAMSNERFIRLERVARELAITSPISEYDAKGLVWGISEVLQYGGTFEGLADAICTAAGAAQTPWCQNRRDRQGRDDAERG